MLPGGVILALAGELGGEAPAQGIDLFSDSSGLPGVLIPDIQVDEVHVVLVGSGVGLNQLQQLLTGDLGDTVAARQNALGVLDILALLPIQAQEVGLIDAVVQLDETLQTGVGRQIPQLVDDHGLVQPAPAVAHQAAGGSADHGLVEGLGLGIGLLCVDMDADLGVVLVSDLQQLLEVLDAAQTLAHIGVLGVGGVVALVAVALQQQSLGQAVGGQVNLLQVVSVDQEGVGSGGLEVHNDTVVDGILDDLVALGVVHDLTECNGAVVPVHLAVAVQIALGNGDLDAGQLGSLVGVILGGSLAGGVAGLVVPDSAGQADGVSAVDALNTLVAFLLGVGVDTGGQLAVGQESVQVAVLVGGDEAVVKADVGIGLGGGGGGHLSAGEDGIGLGSVNGQDVQMGDVDGGDAGAALVLGQLSDFPGQVSALDRDLHGHIQVDAGAGIFQVQLILSEVHVIAAADVLGHDGNAVDDDGVQVGLVAAEEGLAGGVGLHDIAGDQGELLAHIDGHFSGPHVSILAQIQAGLGGDDGVEGVHLDILDDNGAGVCLVAGLGDGEGVLAHLDTLEGVAAVLIGLGGAGADADGGTGDSKTIGVGDGTGNGSHGGLDDLHGLTGTVSAETPVVVHAVLAVVGEVSELDVGVGILCHDAELTQVAVGVGEGLGQGLQGLVGGVRGGAVDGNGQGLVTQGDGQAQLLAGHSIGQTGDLRIVLGAVDLVLVVPVAGGVVADVQPVVVVDVAVKDAPVLIGLQGHGDGASADHVSVAVQVEDGTACGVAVIVTAGAVRAAVDGEPFSAAGSVGDDDAACAAQHQGRNKDQGQNLASGFFHVCFPPSYFTAQVLVRPAHAIILSLILLQINCRFPLFFVIFVFGSSVAGWYCKERPAADAAGRSLYYG